MSTFDPSQFLDFTTTDANSTERVPCPPGEYDAQVEKLETRTWTSKTDPTKSGVTLEVTWSIQDQTVLQQLDKDKVTVKQGVMLDFTDTGSLDMGKGKNIGLGRLRAATGNNVPGRPFAPSMLMGCMAKVRVSHEPSKDDPSVVYDRVTAVAPM